MSQFVEYIAKKGDRFDTVAFKAYAETDKLGLIIAANRHIGIVEGDIPEGTVVRVPVLEQLPTPEISLPPWKR